MPRETEQDKVWLYRLTALGFQLNSAIERGLGNKISFDDIHRGLDNGDLFERIEEKLPNKMDLAMFADKYSCQYPGLKEGTLKALYDAAAGMEGREKRKYGVVKSGLSLLMAYVLEAIQQNKYWVIPDRPSDAERKNNFGFGMRLG